MKVRKSLPPLALLAGLFVTAACGGADAPPVEPAAESAAPEPAAAAGGSPRVFFVEPKDGSTVKSPVRLVFEIGRAHV